MTKRPQQRLSIILAKLYRLENETVDATVEVVASGSEVSPASTLSAAYEHAFRQAEVGAFRDVTPNAEGGARLPPSKALGAKQAVPQRLDVGRPQQFVDLRQPLFAAKTLFGSYTNAVAMARP